MVRVKICGIRNEEDLNTAVAAGADAVCFLVGQVHASPSVILPGPAARLATALPPYVQPVLVTHLTEPAEILDLVSRTGIYTIQLHGGSTPEQVATLRDKLIAQAKLIVATHLQEERQILDLMDYISNSFLMPLISLLTCIFIGWVVKPTWIAEEMELGGCRFGRKKLYGVMIRYIAPVIMAVLFVQSMGLLSAA